MAHLKSKFESLSVNVPMPLVKRIDQQVEANGPFARRHSVHLAALALGLDVLAAHPAKLEEAVRAVQQLRHQEEEVDRAVMAPSKPCTLGTVVGPDDVAWVRPDGTAVTYGEAYPKMFEVGVDDAGPAKTPLDIIDEGGVL